MAQNSTTVRFIASSLRALATVRPEAAARVASDLFFHAPPRRRSRPAERETLDAAERLVLPWRDERLAAWRWGRGPLVLLVHGWGGSAGQLHALVGPLVRSGRSVLAVDLPGHGASTGRSTSLPEMADALRTVVDAPLAGIVAHSLGGAAALSALAGGLQAERVALIGPPAHPIAWFRDWVGGIVDGRPLEEAQRAVEQRLGCTFAALEGARLAAHRADPLLVVHDRHDKEVAVEEGREIAEAAGRGAFVETVGLGHRRILGDPRVVALVTRFLLGRDALPSGCAHGEGDLPCHDCALAEALWCRSDRWIAA